MVSMWATHFSSLFSHCNVIVIPQNKLANIFNLGQYSISTKRKEIFPSSHLSPFFGQSFVVGHLTTAGINGKLMLICFWQQSYPVSLRYWQHVPFGKPPFPQSISIIKERPLSLPLWCVVSHIVLSIAAFIFSWWLVCFLQRYVMVVHFLWFAIFRSFWWCFSSNIVTVHHLLQSYLVMHHFPYCISSYIVT